MGVAAGVPVRLAPVMDGAGGGKAHAAADVAPAPSSRLSPSGTVLSLGELLIDIIVADGAPSLVEAEAFVARPGGAPANVVVALARMGVPSGFCGVVGADPFGERLRTTLEADGVDTSALRSDLDTETSLAFAWKDARGDGNFRILRLADTRLSADDVVVAKVAERSAVVVGSVALSVQPSRDSVHLAVREAREAGVPVVFDVNMRPSIWRSMDDARAACRPVLDLATVLKLSLDDARALFGVDGIGEIARADLGSADQLLFTDGARGAWFARRGEEPSYVPAFVVDAVEPTGAGDAFTAGIVCRLIESGWSALDAADVRFAAAAGAITATRVGAMEALPYRHEIEEFLDGHA